MRRLKYTIEDRGLEWFVGEVQKRAGVTLEAARAFAFDTHGDLFGWRKALDGTWHRTLRIQPVALPTRKACHG
jgi:sulfite reductase (NADPH) hemoprotein beta-component